MKKSILLFIIFLTASVSAQPLRFFEFAFRIPLADSLNVVAAASDSALIDRTLAQLSKPEAERSLFINGNIQYGTGTNNPRYSWHFVTNAWDLVENAIEVCDGTPTDVENDKKYWIETVGSFCPWSSYVKREIIPSNVIGDARDNAIRLYPNPTQDMLRIETDPSLCIRDLCIMDALGKIVSTSSSRDKTIDLTTFPHGTYYIVIRHSAGNKVFKVAKD